MAEAKTVVGFFGSRTAADEAASNLAAEGFPRETISLLASDRQGHDTPAVGPVHDVGADTELGRDATIGAMAGFAAGAILSVIPGIGLVLAIGPIAAAIGGLGVGAAAGGIIGLLQDHGVSEDEAEYYAEGLRRGGALVSVRTTSDEESRAEKILDRSGAEDVIARVEEWRAGGWKGFDPNAPPYGRAGGRG